MAQSGTVASGGSVDLVVASYETLRVYDAGGIAGTLSKRNALGGFDAVSALDQWTTGEARGWGGPGTFRISVTAGAARYVVDGVAFSSGAYDAGARGSSAATNLKKLLWSGTGQRAVGFTRDAGTNSDATNNSFNNWSRHFLPTGRKARALRVEWSRCDITADGEADRAQDITNFAASIVINNTVHRLFFGGAASTTITAGRGTILSDPLWIDTGAATDFVVRAYGKWTGTLALAGWPDGSVLLTGEGCNRGTDLANRTMDAYNATAPANNTGLFTPVAVHAMLDAETPVVGLLTDSTGKGRNDTANATYGWKGYIQKSLGNALPWIYTGATVNRITYLATRDDGERSALMNAGITHLILAMVTYDVAHSRTKAQILADQQTVCARYWPYGIKTYITTCPPITSGTYTSAEGQTIANAPRESVRLDYNADVRANWAAYGHAGLIDIASVIEDAAAPGKWVSSGGIARTNDGLNPNPSGVLDLVNAGIVRPDMFTLT